MNKPLTIKTAATAPVAQQAQGVLRRQCSCGNHSSGGECDSCAKKKLQRKLTIGATNDPLELEADLVAEQVLANKPAHSFSNISTPKIQRRAEQASAQTEEVPASVERVLASSGSPLPITVRKDMEQRFGQDFSQVRMHIGSAAEQSATDVSANAYTVGNNIVFNRGKFSPETQSGKRLLAHELTHVVQQSHGVRQHENTDGRTIYNGISSNTASNIHGRVGVGLYRDEASEEELKKLRQATPKQCDGGRCHPSEPKAQDWRKMPPLPSNSDIAAWIKTPVTAPSAQSNAHPSPDKRTEFEKAKAEMASPENTARMARAIPDLKAAEAAEAAKKQAEARKGIALSHSTGSMYLDPDLKQPAAEKKLAEQHATLKMLSPEIAEHLERDPGYMKAMGKYAEDIKASDTLIPKATPGVATPFTLSLDGKPPIVDKTAPYWKTPRGQARLELKREIEATKIALEALYGERHDIVDSSIVIRKVAESMVGVKPPPIATLNQCSALLASATEKLANDEIEQAAKLHSDASRLRREAGWYWARYKEFLIQGGERTVEGLEMVRDTSKYSLMVLSMAATGGSSAPLWVGTAGGIAIEATDAGVRSALGEKVDWSKVAVNTALQIVLARFGGRITHNIFGKLAQQPAFANIEKSVVAGAIKSVINGMEARMVTSAVGSAMRGDTWGQTADKLVDSLVSWHIFLDLVLGAAHASLKKGSSTKPTTEPSNTSKSAGKNTSGPHEESLPKKNATAAHEEGPVKKTTELVENVTPETKTLYERRPELKAALANSPRAALALKKCASPCFPDFATPTQIDRLESIIATAEQFGGKVKYKELTAYLRSKKNWAALESSIEQFEGQIASKRGVLGEFAEGAKRVGTDQTTPQGREATTALRAKPGSATGGEDLPEVTGKWFPERPGGNGATDVRVGRIPRQIAERMRGMDFKNFDDFRETFWKMVASDTNLRKQFAYYDENLTRMQSGLAPWVPSRKVGATRVESKPGASNAVYQLDHKQGIKNEGGVYDLGNIDVVTPVFHGEVGQ